MTINVVKLKIILALFLLHPLAAHAEVLDKFGGCQSPRHFKWLITFALIIALFRFLQKFRVASFFLFLSFSYILVDIILTFMAAKRVAPSWFDQAIFSFYEEIETCSQYATFGYWQQVWLSVLVYLFSLFIIFKFTARRLNE